MNCRATSKLQSKVLFAMLGICRNNYFNIETVLYVFDTYVYGVIIDGFEILDFHTAKDIEKLHIPFCKTILVYIIMN